MNLQHTLGCAALSLSFAGLSLLTAAPAEAFTLIFGNGDSFGGEADFNLLGDRSTSYAFDFLDVDKNPTGLGNYGNWGMTHGTGTFAPYSTNGLISDGYLIKSVDFTTVGSSITSFLKYDNTEPGADPTLASWEMDLKNITFGDFWLGTTRFIGIDGTAVFRSGNTVTGEAAFSTQLLRTKENPHTMSFNAAIVPEPTGVLGAGIAVTMMAGLRKRSKQNA
ncbi:PEP-CTERM sorting domain-containing protein [Phormidium yuhuli AB48]|uniref:PEP-CTERM sorting domain-containing protein n=1 Tax=Phormidium yuhuli AB48 TaxID=2940671 RepID=A0ABY5AT64_9CYAN|nr:PEP-CTERM sorting domain-containing protein [Phormidium yuhuli]USR91434.1 PEP-CTERM sorting domain-containing protein [Phormidium yuhuli AB48]